VAFPPTVAQATAQLVDFLMQQVYLRGENAERDRREGPIAAWV
jgi:hypothetical protein